MSGLVQFYEASYCFTVKPRYSSILKIYVASHSIEFVQSPSRLAQLLSQGTNRNIGGFFMLSPLQSSMYGYFALAKARYIAEGMRAT